MSREDRLTALAALKGDKILDSNTLYRKYVTSGGKTKYEPVIMEIYSGVRFRYGFHMICSRPGYTSYVYDVDPDYASLLAASHDMKEEMCKEMGRKLHDITWTNEEKTCGLLPSINDVVEAGIKILIEKAKEAK